METNENIDTPAFPCVSFSGDGHFSHFQEGLTKREYFAGIAMQGFLGSLDANNVNWCPSLDNMQYIVKSSVTISDLLIKELNSK